MKKKEKKLLYPGDETTLRFGWEVTPAVDVGTIGGITSWPSSPKIKPTPIDAPTWIHELVHHMPNRKKIKWLKDLGVDVNGSLKTIAKLCPELTLDEFLESLVGE